MRIASERTLASAELLQLNAEARKNIMHSKHIANSHFQRDKLQSEFVQITDQNREMKYELEEANVAMKATREQARSLLTVWVVIK